MKHTLLNSPTFRLFCRLFCLTVCFATPVVQAAVILQYHHVDDTTPPSTSISPTLFEQHLAYIEEHNFDVWPLPKAIAQLKANKALPDKVVIITFDDAYESIYRNAYPLLKSRGLPFTVFVATQPIEQKLASFMSWSELNEMANNGATIANHTHTHAHLVRRLTGESEDAWLARLQEEINQPEQLIQKHISQTDKLFAYPYGEYTKQIQSLLEEMGYTAFGQQSGAIGLNMEMTSLPRFPMTNRFGAMPQFETKIWSLPMAAERLEPDIKIVSGSEFARGFVIQFKEYRAGLNCFFEGQPLTLAQDQKRVKIDAFPELPVGRSRINCTAPSGQSGRFYWFSHAWIKPKPDGSWYEER